MIENITVVGRVGEKSIRPGDVFTVAFDFEHRDGLDKPAVRTNLLEVNLFVEFIHAYGQYIEEGTPCLGCAIGLIGYDASAIVTSRRALATRDTEQYFMIMKDH